MDRDGPSAAKSGDGRVEPSRVPLIHPTDLRLTIIILAACAGLYYVTTGFEQVSDMFAQDVPPEFFPRLLLWTIALLTLLMPFEHLYLRKRNRNIDAARVDPIKPISFFTAALLAALVASITWLGTWWAMMLACVALPLLWGEWRLKWVIPFAVLFPGVVMLLFSRVLNVYLEPGLLWSTVN